jgi:hypothetical protein
MGVVGARDNLMAIKKKKKDEITAQDWLEKIQKAKNAKDNWRNKFRVDLSYEYYEGRQRPAHIPAEEWITINLIYSQLQSELPTLYSTDPYYYVKLRKSFSTNPMDLVLFEQKAKIRQAYLNYLKQELELKPKIRLSILDAFFQFGIIKVNYSADLIENPKNGQPVMEENETIFDNFGNPIIEPEYLPANGKYKVTRIHPNDFFVDCDAGPLDDEVNWKCHRFKKNLKDVQNDKKYEKSARDKVKATELSDEPDKLREDRQKGPGTYSHDEKEPDLVIIYEIYDLKEDKFLVISEGCDEFLLKPQDLPPGIEQDPFVDLRFTMRDSSWYPIPPISQWIDPQREFCELRSKVQTHRKRFNRKYELDAKAYSDPENAAAKLITGDDGTVLIKDGMAMGIGVSAIQDAPLDQQIHMEYGYIRQDFMELSMGPNQRGATAGVDSATEAGILEKRTVIREGDRIGLVSDFMKEIGRKLDMQVQIYLTEPQAVKVIGPEGEFWEEVSPEDYQEIKGEYEYSLDVGATTPQLPEIERAQWISFLNLVAAAPQLALSKQLLKKTAEMHHINDQVLIEELQGIAEKMMSGALSGPGGGSTPNVQPGTANAGKAAGINNIRGGRPV